MYSIDIIKSYINLYIKLTLKNISYDDDKVIDLKI